MSARETGPTMDLNADLGEGLGPWAMGDDQALLGVVSSANVACGFHAGDALTMRTVCAAAAAAGVSVGAHVAYRDLHGFGRRFMEVPADELAADVLYQLAALDGIARTEGAHVAYLKPHGALYNAIVTHEQQAAAVVAAAAAFRAGLPVYGLPGSVWLGLAAEAGLRPVAESFADRGYAADGSLVPRSHPGAVLHDPDVIARRVVRLATQGAVDAVDGSTVTVSPDSVCVHGDTPGAVAIARSVRAALEGAGVAVRPAAR